MKIKHKISIYYSKLIEKINQINIKIMNFIKANDVEIVMFIGLFFIIYASFLLNKVLGFYSIGIIFISLGIFLLKYPRRRL